MPSVKVKIGSTIYTVGISLGTTGGGPILKIGADKYELLTVPLDDKAALPVHVKVAAGIMALVNAGLGIILDLIDSVGMEDLPFQGLFETLAENTLDIVEAVIAYTGYPLEEDVEMDDLDPLLGLLYSLDVDPVIPTDDDPLRKFMAYPENFLASIDTAVALFYNTLVPEIVSIADLTLSLVLKLALEIEAVATIDAMPLGLKFTSQISNTLSTLVSAIGAFRMELTPDIIIPNDIPSYLLKLALDIEAIVASDVPAYLFTAPISGTLSSIVTAVGSFKYGLTPDIVSLVDTFSGILRYFPPIESVVMLDAPLYVLNALIPSTMGALTTVVGSFQRALTPDVAIPADTYLMKFLEGLPIEAVAAIDATIGRAFNSPISNTLAIAASVVTGAFRSSLTPDLVRPSDTSSYKQKYDPTPDKAVMLDAAIGRHLNGQPPTTLVAGVGVIGRMNRSLTSDLVRTSESLTTLLYGNITNTEQRYFRNNTVSRNGLTGYDLNLSQGTTSTSLSNGGSGDWGITFYTRVYKRNTLGTETELSSGYGGVMTRLTSGSGIQSAGLSISASTASPTDTLVVRVYAYINGAYLPLGVFHTEQLGANGFVASTLSLTYYTGRTYDGAYTYAWLYVGNATYNSWVGNIKWTEPY